MVRIRKKEVSVVICGHVDSGKSTVSGRLIYELGGITRREMVDLIDETYKVNNGSNGFAFYMDKTKQERERGVTITCKYKEFYTKSFHYTIIDTPGRHDFIKKMISGASKADAGILLVSADSTFPESIAEAIPGTGEVRGHTRHYALLLKLLGVKQLIVCVNKMDCEEARYRENHFNVIMTQVRRMLMEVGWSKDYVTENLPVIPISGCTGDNLRVQSNLMEWWEGCQVLVGNRAVLVHTLTDALENFVEAPKRSTTAKLRMPVVKIYKMDGVGDIVTGRIEQGTLKPNDYVKFVLADNNSNGSKGTVFTIQRYHKTVARAEAGDIVGINVKGMEGMKLPRAGDVLVMERDESLKQCATFTARVEVFNYRGLIYKESCPIALVREGRSPCRIIKINWKEGMTTEGVRVSLPRYVKASDMAEVVFKPLRPFVVEPFDSCSGLGRIAMMYHGSVVMLGEILTVDFVE